MESEQSVSQVHIINIAGGMEIGQGSYPLYTNAEMRTYSVMGLLMCGDRFGFLPEQEGGVERPVPHLGGWCLMQWPLEGSICLSVDHCSEREEGADVWMRFSSEALEKAFRGASESGTQWEGRVERSGRAGERNLCLWTGVELRRSSGVYHLFAQTSSVCLLRGTLADQKCLL